MRGEGVLFFKFKNDDDSPRASVQWFTIPLHALKKENDLLNIVFERMRQLSAFATL